MPNKGAKNRKRNRKKLNDWLKANGRTANQYKKKKLKRPLTPKEAMDLSIKRREIKTIENKIKDHLNIP